MKGCLVGNFHKFLESRNNTNIVNDIEFKKKREIGNNIIQCDNQHCQNCNKKLCQNSIIKIIHYGNLSNIEVQNENCDINQMLCSLFPHLKSSNTKLALGCVNVFGGLQSLCTFVHVNFFCSAYTKCSSQSHGMIVISVWL
jgi:hypothetical protein